MENSITVEAYAKKMEVSRPAVTKACSQGKRLVGIASYDKKGRDWFLTPEPGFMGKRKYVKGKIISKLGAGLDGF